MVRLQSRKTRPNRLRPLENGDTLYVHPNSGGVVETSPATAVCVNNETLDALNGDMVVATFARDDVYFAADGVMEPPPLE